MKIRGIIFDLDGTLINTIEDIGDSMNFVLRKLGREELSYGEYKIKVGGGFRKLVKSILPDLEDEDYDYALKLLEASYRENYLSKSKPYEDMEKLLGKLSEKKIKLGINTNKNQEYTNKLIEKVFGDVDFVEIVGVDQRGFVKPDPSGAELVLEKMGLAKEEVLYVGDSNIDMLTGKNAGLKTVGVDWGFRGEAELRQYGADFIAYEPLDILRLIE